MNDATQTSETATTGLEFEPHFCPAGTDPFDTVEWERRTAEIRSETGEVVFEQADCEFPASWSQRATNVVASKYFFGEPGTEQREGSVRQLVFRVARTIADWGLADGYFATPEDGENFYRELAWLLLHQHAAFNSPVWFNVGVFEQYGVTTDRGHYGWDREAGQVRRSGNAYDPPQCSACFIQSVRDDLDDIMALALSEARLFKYGSGTGTDLTPLRSQREVLSGGGRPSGPLSFMRVYDQIAGVVKSGGKTRRAAKMQTLHVGHPDVLEFVRAKPREEDKAAALIASGECGGGLDGEAYQSVMFQNANLSVRVSDDFLQAVENGDAWQTHWIIDPTKPGPEYDARELLREIAQGAWRCGDPGLQYETTINSWHTCPHSGTINSSNPCSEFVFLDDTACNLASVNLRKMQREDGTLDVARLRRAAAVLFTAQEILVDRAGYPTAVIAENSHRFRPLGLGYANLGALLTSLGIAYDSDEGRGMCGAVTALLTAQAYQTSSEIARHLGPFEGFDENRAPMLAVIERHAEAVEAIDPACPDDLVLAARELWQECLESGRRHGFRNAQATVIAPTGTISFLMDCDTTGIEPELALVKYKRLAGGGTIRLTSATVPEALRRLGYDEDDVEAIVEHVEQQGTIEGAPGLREEHLPVFDCAFPAPNGSRSIRWKAHLQMMAAAQPFLSGAISKTVNLPHEATVEDVEEACLEGWRLGLKALALYRDGSKGVQPVSTREDGGRVSAAPRDRALPVRRRMPETRDSITHKFSVGGHEGYITVGLYEDGTPGEVFLNMAKEGSTIGGLMDVIGTETSLGLQYGVPLEVFVDKFAWTRFEPSGWTGNPDIRRATSIVDYVFRWLGNRFLPESARTATSAAAGESPETSPSAEAEAENESPPPAATFRPALQSDAPPCAECGAMMVRRGACFVCENCGHDSGCG